MSSKIVFDNAKLKPRIEGDTVFFGEAECLGAGKTLHDEYVGNSPFPHIVIDDFLPQDALRRVVAEFPERAQGQFADAHSNLKTGYQLEKIKSAYITNLINALNSAQFLTFLEEMTGIKGLISDPHQMGGGLHETARGGHLSIHADFNMHPKLKTRRRVNLILFLNENWDESYGGALELWKIDMSACEKSVIPVLGRAVVFNTESDSFHGHPDPLDCPEGVFRRSLALYYYTVPEGAEMLEPRHTTDFRVRPGTSDNLQLKNKFKELMRDLMPPMLYRAMRRRKQK